MKHPLLILSLGLALSLMSCQKKSTYITNDGYIFGSTFHMIYQHQTNLEDTIMATMTGYNASLSTYDSTSVISRVNQNDTTVVLDANFIEFFNESQRIAQLTNGAFDITVAPLVNAWGFGFKNLDKVDSTIIQNLMPCVGFQKVQLANNRIIKQNPCLMLDANAIGPGQAADIVGRMLESYNIKNYMIEIGGEVRARGVNAKGVAWRIGIDKPIENTDAANREIQTIVNLNNASLATSGNYRAFYEKDGIKYSHTIDPKTGFPARSNLLSVSVLTTNCMTADAMATSFMVMGLEKTKKMADSLPDTEVYLIYSDSTGAYQTYATKGFSAIIAE